MEKSNLWIGVERRRHPRIAINIPLIFQMVKPSLFDKPRLFSPSIKTSTENFSLVGLLMVTQNELSSGDIINIVLHPPSMEPIEAQARVVRVHPSQPKTKYYVSLQFTLSDEAELKSMLQSLVKDYDELCREMQK